MSDAIDLDDLPEIVDDPDSPHCWQRPIVFGPEAMAQIRRMQARPMPDWLKSVVLKHAANKAREERCTPLPREEAGT